VPAELTSADYRSLAALRYRIRFFLRAGDAAARRAGLEPQQYSLMLAVRGLPEATEPTIQTLAEQLTLKHNSTVELIDRLERRGYVYRSRSPEDRRRVLVSLLPRGDKLVAGVARQRIAELRAEGTALVDALDALLGRRRESQARSVRHTKRGFKQSGARKNRITPR
jgi:DNA-binding MarR family transcriptional regulator